MPRRKQKNKSWAKTKGQQKQAIGDTETLSAIIWNRNKTGSGSKQHNF